MTSRIVSLLVEKHGFVPSRRSPNLVKRVTFSSPFNKTDLDREDNKTLEPTKKKNSYTTFGGAMETRL